MFCHFRNFPGNFFVTYGLESFVIGISHGIPNSNAIDLGLADTEESVTCAVSNPFLLKITGHLAP